MTGWTKDDYERLGDYVTQTRIRAGMDRALLAAESSINYKTLADIELGELGKRKSFSAETLESIGLSLGWKPGSWRRILNGDEPLLEQPTADEEAQLVDVEEFGEVTNERLLREIRNLSTKLDALRIEPPVSEGSGRPSLAIAAHEDGDIAGEQEPHET